jgi:Protein of unknown function (DUF1573)
MTCKLTTGVLALVLLAASAVRAQDAPRIAIEQIEHNFGEVLKGVTLQHSFRFKNEGKADLEIRNVAPS